MRMNGAIFSVKPWSGQAVGAASWKRTGPVSMRLSDPPGSPIETTMPNLPRMLENARRISWNNLGRRITFFLPGMFIQNGLSGKYPAVSITGSRCDLMCDHCQGKLLESMIPAPGPEALFETWWPSIKRRHRGSDQWRLQPGRAPAVGAVSAGHKGRQRKDPAVHFRARGVRQ